MEQLNEYPIQQVGQSVLSDQQIEMVEAERSKMQNDPNYMLDWETAYKGMMTKQSLHDIDEQLNELPTT